MIVLSIVNNKKFTKTIHMSKKHFEHFRGIIPFFARLIRENNIDTQDFQKYCRKYNLIISVFDVDKNKEVLYDIDEKLVGEQLRLSL